MNQNPLLDSLQKRGLPGTAPPEEPPEPEDIPSLQDSLGKRGMPGESAPPEPESSTESESQDTGEQERIGMSSLSDLSDQANRRLQETTGMQPKQMEKILRGDNYDWRIVRKVMMENWDTKKQLGSLGEEILSLVQMFALMGRRGEVRDKDGNVIDKGNWTLTPGLTDIGHLLFELETKLEMKLGGEKLKRDSYIGTPIDWLRGLQRMHGRQFYGLDYEDSETPMLDAAIEFYRQRYPFDDPDFSEKFGMVLATDLAGVLADFSMVLSLAGGLARGTAKGASVAQRGIRARMDARLAKVGWQPSKMALAWEKHLGGFAEGADRVADIFNKGMKKPSLSSIPGMPGTVNTLLAKSKRFAERWGLADVFDPASYPIIAGMELLRGNQVRAQAAKQAAARKARKSIGASNMEMRASELPRMPDEALIEAYDSVGAVRGNPQRLIGPVANDPLNRLDAEYVVFEGDNVIFSNHPLSGAPNEMFPAQYQQRDRQLEEAMTGVREKASSLAPEMVIQQSASMTEGTPIVVMKRDPETNEVKFYALGGNGRLMAIESARRQGFKGAENYKQFLIEEAATFGIDPARIEGMEKPVLVRVLRSELDEDQTVRASRLFNEGAPEAQRASEVAGEDVNLITQGLLIGTRGDGFHITKDTSLERMLSAPSNESMLMQFIGGVPRGERAALMTDGAPNRQAIDRFMNAFISRAYAGADPRLRNFLLESGKELKNVQTAALMVVPKIIEIKNRTENQQIDPEYDIGTEIGQAIAFYVDVYNDKASGRANTIETVLGQSSLFGGTEVSGTVKLLARFFEENRTKPRVMRETLNKYFDNVLKERLGLLDTMPSKKEMLAEALEGRFEEPEDLARLLEGVSDLAEVPQNVEKAADAIEDTNDALDNNADLRAAGESNRSTLDEFTNENNQQWKAALDEKMAEMMSTGEISPDTMVVIENFLDALSPEMRHEFVTRMTNLGARQEFLDRIQAVAEPQLEEAIKNYQSALEADPTNRHAHVGMYWANRQLNNKAEAERWAREAVKVAPDDPYTHSALGSALMEKGDYEGAANEFSRALAFQSNDSFALKGRALAYTYMDMLDEADADMSRAIDLDRMNAEQKGSPNIETARDRLNAKLATETEERTAKSMAGRGWGRFEKGEYHDAIARATEAVKIDENYPESYNVRGWANYRLGKYEDSFWDFELMLQRTSSDDRRGLEFGYNGRGYNNYRLAQALIREGRKQEGLQKLLAAQEDLSRAEALKQGVAMTEGIETTPEVPELPYVRRDDDDGGIPFERTEETDVQGERTETTETTKGTPPEADDGAVTDDVQTAIRLLDESKQNIRIEMMDNQKVGIYEGLDENGNPVEKRLAHDADTPDDVVQNAVLNAIETEQAAYRQRQGGEGGDGEPEPTPESDMPDTPEAGQGSWFQLNMINKGVLIAQTLERMGLEQFVIKNDDGGIGTEKSVADAISNAISEFRREHGKVNIEDIEGIIEGVMGQTKTDARRDADGDAESSRQEQQTSDIPELERRVEDMRQRADQANQALEQAENAEIKGVEGQTSLDIIRNSAERWNEELRKAEEELANARRDAGGEGGGGDDGGAPPPDAPPEVALGDIMRFRDFLENYIRDERSRERGEMNRFTEDYIVAFDALMEDLTAEVIGRRPEWKDVAGLFQDAENMVVSKIQADFIDFIKQELAYNIGDIERFNNIRDQLFEETQTAEDARAILNQLEPEDQRRARAAFLQKYIDDWVDGDRSAMGQLVKMSNDGRIEAFLGPEVVEAMETFDDLIRDFQAGDGGLIDHRRKLEDAQKEQERADAEAAEAQRELDETNAREAEEMQQAEAEQMDAEESDRTEESRQNDSFQEGQNNLRVRRAKLQAKARQAEAESEAAMLRAEHEQQRIEDTISQQQGRKESAGRTERKALTTAQAQRNDMFTQAREVGRQNSENLARREQAALEEAERALNEREQLVNEALAKEQAGGGMPDDPDAQRRRDAQDQIFDMAGEVGRQREAEAELREIQQAKERIAKKKEDLAQRIANSEQMEEEAARTREQIESGNTSDSQRRRDAQDQIFDMAGEVGRQRQADAELAETRRAEQQEARRQEADDERADRQAQRDRQQQDATPQTADAVDFARTDPQLIKASAWREAQANRSNMIQMLARIGNSGGLGWSIGTMGVHAAVRAASKALVYVADAWQVRQILKRYDSLLDGPEAEKWIIEAFYAMLHHAKEKGTVKMISMATNPARRPSLAPVRVAREINQTQEQVAEEKKPAAKRRPTGGGGLLYNPAQ